MEANTRILIVEDERHLARTLARALRVGSKNQFGVDVCGSTEQAEKLLDTNRYDILISDLRLPGADGLSLISYVKANFPEMQTILMTGEGSEEVQARAEMVSEGYLTKPFDIPDLLLMVEEVINPKTRPNGAFGSGEEPVGSGGKRILIMEDDSGLRRIYSKALQRSDYQVDEAPTIKAARELLKAKTYDIFICDIHMGRELGTELVAEFGETLKESDTQVVMCSAHGEYRRQTKEMGVEYFLEKPVSLNKLLSLIHSLTTQRHVSI